MGWKEGEKMIKTAMLGVAAVLIAIQFKGHKSEYGVYITLAASVLIFGIALTKLEVILEAINEIKGYIKINEAYISLLIKIVGITYVAEFASSLCKDAGYGAVAGQIEVVGKLTILTISMPVLIALLRTMNHFLI